MMKTILFTLVGSVAATTTTPAPSAACTPIGAAMLNLGSGVTGDCCTAAGISMTRAVIGNPDLPDATKATVTTCHAPASYGGCETSGAYAGVLPIDAAGLAAGSIICGSNQTCGNAILNGLTANVAALNGAIKLGMDANSDGVIDLCLALDAMIAAASATTSTTTTTAVQALGESAASSMTSVAAVAGAVAVAALAF